MFVVFLRECGWGVGPWQPKPVEGDEVIFAISMDDFPGVAYGGGSIPA